MITFEAIDAGHGDAILVRYMGDMGVERVLLIDAGPDKTGAHNGPAYNPLQRAILPRLLEIKAERDANPADEEAGTPELTLDLVVCTHVHDDHIHGVRRLFRGWAGMGDLPDGAEAIRAPRLWHNSFSKLVEGVDIDAATAAEAMPLAVSDGETLTQAAGRLGTDVNKGAPGALIAAGQQPAGFGPATITILNPGKTELQKLKKEWETAAKTLKATGATPAAVTALQEFAEDTSVLNLSSITMLIEAFGRRILLTGDQRGDFVLKSLEQLGLKEKNAPFHVDILKVPHHGSKANVQKKFIAGVTADYYVFSANGRDQNPDPEVLEIVATEARMGRKFTMAFTHETMNYMTDTKGKLPRFVGGPEVGTLAEALSHLQKDAAFKRNVTILVRKPVVPGAAPPRSLVISLPRA